MTGADIFIPVIIVLSSIVHSLFELCIDMRFILQNITRCWFRTDDSWQKMLTDQTYTVSWETVKLWKEWQSSTSYTKHIHWCAYINRRYKSQAAANESRSRGTQDVRGKAQRLSEATTRYMEVNRNRREIGSLKFWGKRQRPSHNTHAFMHNFAAG